jgi:uracil-DNA glycosylase
LDPEWNTLQTEIARCELCRKRFQEVDCPPGRIPPEDIPPPDRIEVLFIGVAPPHKGCHFYTDPADKLRRGLFKALKELARPCEGVDALDFTAFLNNHFYLLHTAKCPIRGTSSPSLDVSQFCSSHHLKREIEALQPEAVCWLSKTVCYPVCQSLSREWGRGRMFPFGKVTSVPLKGRNTLFLAAKWPGRGGEKETKAHLSELFKCLQEPI